MARNQDFTLNIKALFDTSDVKNKVNDLQGAFKNIKLPDNLQKSFNKTINDLIKSVNDFESKAGKGIKNKTDATGITKAIDNVIKDFTKVEDIIAKIQSEINNSTDLSQMIKLDDNRLQKIQQLQEDIKKLQQQISSISTDNLDRISAELDNIKSKGAKAGAQKAIELFNNGEIEEALQLLERVKQKQEQIANGNYNEKAKATAESNIDALNNLITTFSNAQARVKGLTDEVNDKTRQMGEIAQDGYREMIDGANQAEQGFRQTGESAREAREGIVGAAEGAASFNSEVDQLKSRIQYFFGLNNAVNLVKRSMRDAYNTIKELDKAMTATAVVTDFSVNDMWAQLPEYTQRANELGVSTKAAYEAATLYYQQGLKTNEVMAMSNETLKMARIAGLDAAVATDRMTNAIRGFNMEINTTNAQRIDDVYSKLAAISASNVDEISTAMTKVASLAHSANMEFETTAAFLAQIIETTRESAETAGTALKTVVARFSEVKKLVDEGKLSGADEEGEVIDVNKVSQALRTAGVDLNKYFLGQVGLDDIFMELASKWKNLTQLQQRYIATQAAGSRQQSRFIALMSDYARTQELVGEAYNANGAAAEQFGKTQESLESKLARLKNAWNEFTMGILNSDLTKGIVDLLTNILNGVNQLTSGFGSLNNGVGGVINSVLKLSTLLMSLRLGKGIIKGLGKGLVGPAASSINFLSVGAGLKTLGVGAAGGLKTLGVGLFKPLASLATSIAPLLPALSAIAAAAGVAYIAIKKLYDASPAGQIKLAEQHAAQLNELAEASKKEKQQLESIQEEYSRLSQAVNNATTVEEKTAAVKSRNEYIKSLLEENEIYAQYINEYEVKDGQIYLTIDEDALQDALDRVSEEAIRREAQAHMGNANVNYQKYGQMASKVGSLERRKAEYKDTPTELTLDKIKELLDTYGSKQNYVQWATQFVYNSTSKSLQEAITEQQVQDKWNSLSEDDKRKQLELIYGSNDISWNKDITWTHEDEAQLAMLVEQMSEYEKKAIYEAGQAALSLIRTKNYSDDVANFVSHVIGASFDSDAYQKAVSEAESWFNGINDYELAYYEAFGNADLVPRTEEGDIDKDAAKAELIAYKTLQELEKNSGNLIETVDDLLANNSDKLKLLIELFNGGKNLSYNFTTADFQKYIKDLGMSQEYLDEFDPSGQLKQQFFEKIFGKEIGEIWPLLTEEIQQRLIDNLSNLDPAGIIQENVSKIFQQSTPAWNKLISTINEKFLKNFNLTTNQTTIISDLFTEFAKENFGQLDGENGFINFLTKLIEGVDEEDLDEFFSLLDNLDIYNTSSIDNFFNILEDLGIDFSEIGGSAEEAAKTLKGLANIKDSINLEEAQKQIDDAIATIWDIKQRNSSKTERTFSNDEYKIIKSAIETAGLNIDISKIFNWTGIKNKEWNYSGEELDQLIEYLINGLNKVISNIQISLESPEWYDDFKNTQFTVTGENNIKEEKSAEDYFQWLLDNDNLTSLDDEEKATLFEFLTEFGYDMDALQAFQPEALKDIIAQALILYRQAQANENNEPIVVSRAVQSVDYLTPINELHNREDMDRERYSQAVNSKFAVDEHASDQYEHILKVIKEITEKMKDWNGTEEDQKVLAKALSVNWSETAAKLTELTEILDKYDKVLYEGSKDSYEYSGAIHAVGEAMRAAYGEQVTDEFVQAHIEQIVMARESKEAYQELLDLLQQDFFANAVYGAEGFTGALWDLQQALINAKVSADNLDGLEIDGVAILDGTPWMKVIEALWDNLEVFEAYLATCGWTLVLSEEKDPTTGLPVSASLVRNQPTGYGGYQPYTGSNWGRGSSGGGGSSPQEKEPRKEEWRSDFDWLYNLMEDITELQREQNKLQEEQNRILELGNDSDTGKDLYENLIKQMANLLTQKAYQSTVQANRQREMQEFMAANAGYSSYFRFNEQDQTLEINWDAINNIGDKETYEKVKELVSQAEAIQRKMDESEDAIRNIEAQIRQLEDIWRDSYANFEKRVLDALIKSYQRVIDNYSDLNDTVTRTNSDILNAIQREISLERQIRDNTATEESISDTEARLAFLRRDTTGGNQVEILNAQKELDEQRRQYEDTLIDQAVARLQDDNEVAAEQRDRQIELMQAQLDYAAETGAFNDQVSDLITRALGADGELLTNSDLFRLLQQEESWSAMSDTSRQIWEDELNNTFKEVAAFLLREQGEIDGSYLQAVASEINNNVWATAQITGNALEVGLGGMGNALEVGLSNIGWSIGSLSQAMEHVTYTYDDAINGLREANAALAGMASQIENQNQNQEPESEEEPEWGIAHWQDSDGYTVTRNGIPYATPNQGAAYEVILRDLELVRQRGYKTGGLTTKTGLAWLDGTPSEPEYVLNARQTDAFLKLAEVLPSMFNGASNTTSNIGGNMYLEFHINIDNISDDYDVDQLVARVKEDIYNAASYRNANIINFSR